MDLAASGHLKGILALDIKLLVAFTCQAGCGHAISPHDWEDMGRNGLSVVDVEEPAMALAAQLMQAHPGLRASSGIALALALATPASTLLSGDPAVARACAKIPKMHLKNAAWVRQRINRV